MPRLARHHARRAAASGHHLHPAQGLVVPGNEDQLLAIARPARPGFKAVLVPARQAARFAPGGGLQPQLAKRFEHHLLAVGRYLRPADHLGLHRIGRDIDHRVNRFRDHAVILHAERNVAHGAVQPDPGQLAAGPQHDLAAVRRPVHVGIDAGDGPGFLHVLIGQVIKLALIPAGQIAHIELRLRPLTPHEGQLLAIGRRGWPYGAAIAARNAQRFATFQIIPLDREQRAVGILRIFKDRTRRDIAREIDALAIGSERRLAQFLLVAFVHALDQRNPAAALDMEQPDFARAERAPGGEVLFRDDVTPVRAPARLVHQAEVFLGQLLAVAAIGIHQPDVVAAAPVGHERDSLAIR